MFERGVLFTALSFCLGPISTSHAGIGVPGTFDAGTVGSETADYFQARVKRLAAAAGGRAAVSIVHIESGATTSVAGDVPLPLFSVFKMALAVVVLKDVEAGRLHLDQSVTVTPKDVVGSGVNSTRWQRLPAQFTIRQLIEFSLLESDNTSCDKLLGLVGGPAALTERLRRLGATGIKISGSTREIMARLDRGDPIHPNEAPAQAITSLLVALHQGKILRPTERAFLWDVMERSRTGLKRLRGQLPAGTRVLDKTGTGPKGSATNDVGIVALPNDGGHVAIAVLIIGSEHSVDAQERAIADIARAAFDRYAPRSPAR